MHEPAACGARPAQQANSHIGPLARVDNGKLPAKMASNMVAPRKALARKTDLGNLFGLVRFITKQSLSVKRCQSTKKRTGM
jgi:hypothetical protein